MDILSILLNILSNSLPSVAIMLTGLFLIFLSQGRGGILTDRRINEGKRKALYLCGWVFLVIGFVLTLVIFAFQVWSSYPKELEAIRSSISENFTQSILTIRSTLFWVEFGSFALFAMILLTTRKYQIEKGYKIQVTPVTRKTGSYPIIDSHALIQVENVGNGTINCCARLLAVNKKDLYGRGTQKILDVHELNPLGRYLGWENWSTGNAILQERIPEVLDLIGGRLDNSTSLYRESKVYIYFAGHEPIPNIGLGEFIIKIKFFRMARKKYIELFTFEETLRVDSESMKWIEKKRGNKMKNQKGKQKKQQEEKKREVFTKEDFLKALKKATRPLTRKASRGKGKSKTSE